jgi:UDP-galactopyranose mutase
MTKIKTDFLIVGTGFYGSVLAERISNILNKKVLIIDKRNHIGGNCYSKNDEKTKIEYHVYGTHIFHTSNKEVWYYLKNFTSFNSYRHQVLSEFKNKKYQMPINLETINSFFNKNFSPSQAEEFIKKNAKIFKKEKYENFEEKALSQIGLKLYNAFIKNYTTKQWNKLPKELPASIFNRLPLRFNYREDYFNNCSWQGIPSCGYTEIFNRLLFNKKISLELEKKYEINNNYEVKYLTIYTGPLDSLFNYKFGKLEWRSLSFSKSIININDYQGTSVINYPELKYKFTRIHEPKHLHYDRNYAKYKTLIIKEYPSNNNNEPYYPINSPENRLLHRQYKKITDKLNKFTYGGRLADYAYYDMDMTISAALQKFKKIQKIIK